MTDITAFEDQHNRNTARRAQGGGCGLYAEPQVLRPFNRAEACSIAAAADTSGKSRRTVRDWCLRHDIGRRIGGTWQVSRIALAMFLDGDHDALRRYLSGDRRSSSIVSAYYERLGIPAPREAL